MSHSDTLRNVKLFAVFLLLAHPCAEAKIKCETLFNPKPPGFAERIKGIFTRKAPQTLTSDQALELKEFSVSDLNIRPYGLGRGTQDPLFMFIWSQIPQSKKTALIDLFENGPQEFKKFRSAISEQLTQHQIESTSSTTYLDLLFSNWGDHLNSTSGTILVFSDWMTLLERQYLQRLNAGEFRVHDLKIKFEQALQFKNAGNYWKSVLGVHVLPVKTEGSQHFVLVNGTWLKAQIDKNSIGILTPRSMIGRAAWNPIYSEVLQAKIANGHQQLKKYPAFLATNGTFYLSDGNHRFILDTRSEVWLEMSYPAKTASMSISFDAIGLPQPSIEKQLKLMNKELTLEDLIGEVIAAKLIYR